RHGRKANSCSATPHSATLHSRFRSGTAYAWKWTAHWCNSHWLVNSQQIHFRTRCKCCRSFSVQPFNRIAVWCVWCRQNAHHRVEPVLRSPFGGIASQVRRCTWTAALVCSVAIPLHAQDGRQVAVRNASPGCESRAVNTRATWAPPLDRIVTVGSVELPLRDALELVVERAQLQISYSVERVPSHLVCVEFDRVPVGAALEHMLASMPLRIIVVGAT